MSDELHVPDELHLVDVASFLHRAMYACYGARAPTVDPDNTRFIEHARVMLARTMDDLRTTRMVVVGDSFAPLKRCEVWDGYKAGRKAHLPVFARQAPRFYETLADLDVSVVRIDGYEADDIIGAYVCHHDLRDVPKLIVSIDQDLWQWIGVHGVRGVYDPAMKRLVNNRVCRERLGVSAHHVVDYLALVGDSSDGIPGVPGIGHHTAVKLLQHFDSFDDIYLRGETAVSEVFGQKLWQRLDAGRESAHLSRQLALPLHCEVPIGDFRAPAPGIVRMGAGP